MPALFRPTLRCQTSFAVNIGNQVTSAVVLAAEISPIVDYGESCL